MIYSAVSVLLVIATLLPLSHHQAWWIRGLDFPRLQLFFAASLLLLCELFFLELNHFTSWLLIIIALACMIYHLWWIFPYTPLFNKEVKQFNNAKDNARLKIITANVLTPNRNAPGLLALVKEYAPDILVTLETDNWWQQQLDVLEVDYPHTIKQPLDNLYGMHVYSRLPLENVSLKFLVEDDVPSMHACVRLSSGDGVSVHFLHPAPPSPTENEESTERDAELLVVAKSVKKEIGPVIVTGDLNDVAWSETTRLFRKLSGLLDPRIGRGMYNTYNAKHWFLRWPLDHIFHSKHFELVTIKRLPKFGSDHFALLTELAFMGSKERDQQGITADQEDKQLAQEKINEEDVDEKDVPASAT